MGRSKEFDENAALMKAMELFWKQGYEKTSLNDLVEYMGVHRKSLYDTFGDKHTLFLKTVDCYSRFIKAKLESETLRATTAKEAIYFIFDFIAEKSSDESMGCFFVNAATELAPCDKELAQKTEEAFSEAETLFANIIRKGQQAGEFSTAYDAEVLAESLHNTLIGIRVLARTTASKEKLHRIVRFSLQILNK